MDYTELVKALRDDNACLSIKTAHEAADAIEELQGQIDGWIEQERKVLLKSMPKWIPVTVRLPQDTGIYIICDHYGNVMSRHFCKSHGKFAGYWHFNGSAKYGNPTHWMPLPEPPKEET